MKLTSRRIARLVLVLAFAAVAPFFPQPALKTRAAGATAVAAKKYQCPMHPEIVRDAPGDCPICGMKLVPMEEKARTGAAATGGTASPGAARKILLYRSPMNSSETSPIPRKDSMGMDFVPVY